MPSTPRLPADDGALAAWIEDRLDEVDTSRARDWRRRAVGGTLAAAMSKLDPHPTLCLKMPRTEHVLVKRFFRERGLSVAAGLRLAICAMMREAGEDPGEWLSQDGG